MLLLAAAAIAASAPPTRPAAAAATARATASVRILSSVSIHWDRLEGDLPRLRLSEVRLSGGERQPIRLIEFE